ncbi:MAG: hypothetical protein H0U94_07545 [Acidobacteria bacterium]|nr:hypothetical protein [Acidobacteriota bacterium]
MVGRATAVSPAPARLIAAPVREGAPGREGERYNNGFSVAPKRAVYPMPISELKAQMARLPEQPGVYLY